MLFILLNVTQYWSPCSLFINEIFYETVHKVLLVLFIPIFSNYSSITFYCDMDNLVCGYLISAKLSTYTLYINAPERVMYRKGRRRNTNLQ